MPQRLMELFPTSLRQVLERMPTEAREVLEEIRIRENRPLEISFGSRYAFVREDGTLTSSYREAFLPGKEQCRALLERLTNHSIYAVEEELRRGFITVSGGHRIGLAGRTVLDKGVVSHLRDIAGFNVRIARARAGFGAQILPDLLDFTARTIRHTLIVSPPQQGKTTLIRDLVRCISSGEWHHPAARDWGSRKVGVVDERSEIAASEKGVPTFDLGPRCDVLDACPKAEGITMMIRSLSPEIIAVDEIGRPEDAEAIHEAIHAGVQVLATAHALDIGDVFARPVLAKLARDGVFGTYVFLSRTGDKVKHRVISAEEALEATSRRFSRTIGAMPRDAPFDPIIAKAHATSTSPTQVTVKARQMPVIRSPALQEPQGIDHA
ncbi:stage III sporulation protein AA [Cohnella mopanensis]|uniref:stage III sporulation protein AA n=1 Tax=Cohnella mopanensis TaxID=2911966 RepID=UPI001EF7912E|nr:stage III sporulation protein AA [Cohnella mopanensis]